MDPASKALLLPKSESEEVKIEETKHDHTGKSGKSGLLKATGDEDFDQFFQDLEEDIVEAQKDVKRGRWRWVAATSGMVVGVFAFVVWFFVYVNKLKNI